MAESREHIWKYALKKVQSPYSGIILYDTWDLPPELTLEDLREKWVDGAEWMRNRAEKRREKEALKYRREITKLRKEIIKLQKQIEKSYE
jgi:hypothetical protein